MCTISFGLTKLKLIVRLGWDDKTVSPIPPYKCGNLRDIGTVIRIKNIDSDTISVVFFTEYKKGGVGKTYVINNTCMENPLHVTILVTSNDLQ